MSKKRHVISDEILDNLRKRTEQVAGRRMKTPLDFDWLSNSLTSRARSIVSATTLKRFWGYNKDVGTDYQPSRYTLCALARYIGYDDIEALIEDKIPDDSSIQSAEYIGETIDADIIPVDTIIDLTWSPRRHCVLRAMGDRWFRVEVSQNSRLKPGDMVSFASITRNAPLYFNSLCRPNEQPTVYIAGSRTGVDFSFNPGLDTADND